MSREIFYKVVSDLSKTTLEEDDVNTVQFGWAGSTYELDLSNEEATELTEMMEKYTAAGRKVSRTAGTRTSAPAAKSDKEYLARIREWAVANGREVNSRGRIKQELKDAYEASL